MSKPAAFISYRRKVLGVVENPFGLLIFQNLSQKPFEFDMFLDIDSLVVGDFGKIILDEISNRPCFIPILMPGTFERCRTDDGKINSEDWILREIQQAVTSSSQIVPVHLPDFDFGDLDKYLPPLYAKAIKDSHSIELSITYFTAAMEKLANAIRRGSSNSVQSDLVSSENSAEVKRIQDKAAEQAANIVGGQALVTAQLCFNEAYSTDDLDTKIQKYTEAIAHNPNFPEAYYNRGLVYHERKQLDRAAADYQKAIELRPHYPEAYNNLGDIFLKQEQWEKAVEMFTISIDQNNPILRYPLSNRSIAYIALGKIELAEEDKRRVEGLRPTKEDANGQIPPPDIIWRIVVEFFNSLELRENSQKLTHEVERLLKEIGSDPKVKQMVDDVTNGARNVAVRGIAAIYTLWNRMKPN